MVLQKWPLIKLAKLLGFNTCKHLNYYVGLYVSQTKCLSMYSTGALKLIVLDVISVSYAKRSTDVKWTT